MFLEKISNFNKYKNKQFNRNENIICAVLSLLKELDQNSLELIRRDVDRKLCNKKFLLIFFIYLKILNSIFFKIYTKFFF